MKQTTQLYLLIISALLHSPKAQAQGRSASERLGTEVNSIVTSEVLPVISADGRSLYFARPRMGIDGTTVIDIWKSTHFPNDSFSDAHILGGHLGSRYGIAVTSVAPDNNTLYVIGKLRPDQSAEDRVMVSHRTKGGWSLPKPIHITDLQATNNVIDFAFGPDQRTLIISMEHDSSMGEHDLYVCFLDEATNTWSKPRWLGPEINSIKTEITPYLAADAKTLYFSSDRPGNIGELDVWRAERLDDSWQHWSKPEHLDGSINSLGRTSYYTEDASGKFAYYVWRRNSRDQTDIYRAPAPARITQVVLIAGVVSDDSGVPLDATIRYERLSDGKTLGLAYSDPSTGKYQITLPAGEEYGLYAQESGYVPTSETFDANGIKAFSTVTKNLTLIKIKGNALIPLNNIFFETDKATLLPSSFAEINRLVAILTQNPTLRVSIEGHTDSTGSAVHNQSLSHDRAQAVVTYMITQGIDASRLQSHGFGSERPIASNAIEEGRARNRRVELRIISE